jgi:nucleotide-binding universal stress UspA family protein
LYAFSPLVRLTSVRPEKTEAHMIRLKKILVAIDFSSCSLAAFKYAKSLAKKFSASIELIHVVDKWHVAKIAELYSESEDSVAEKLCLEARKRFKAFQAENSTGDPPAEEIITVGIPFQAIALKAQGRGVDMIVMGGHGRMGNGEIDKIFFGSTAEKVVRLMPCPVLCVPPEIAASVTL